MRHRPSLEIFAAETHDAEPAEPDSRIGQHEVLDEQGERRPYILRKEGTVPSLFQRTVERNAEHRPQVPALCRQYGAFGNDGRINHIPAAESRLNNLRGGHQQFHITFIPFNSAVHTVRNGCSAGTIYITYNDKRHSAMEDMLLREIEKTGKVLEAILLKLGVTTREKGEEAYDTARTGLREGLGMDFDAVLGSDDIAGALTAGYGFGDDNLERFARILFLLAAGTPDDDTRRRTASPPQPSTNTSKAAAPAASYDRYYILKELEKLSLTPRISRCSSSHIWLSGHEELFQFILRVVVEPSALRASHTFI